LGKAIAVIDTQALLDNYQQICRLAPQAKVLAVLKANAYGHGLVRIAKALTEANAFGVARIDEALALRAGGIIKPIVLLEGFFAAADLPLLAVNDLQTIVHNIEQLEAIEQAHLQRPLKVWLKVDTGMHRLGVAQEDFAEFYRRLKASNNVQNEIVLMSHLACADDVSFAKTEQQISDFVSLTQELDDEKSLANSAGLLAWPKSHFHWVRPGLLLYGVSPMLKSFRPEHHVPMSPVMTLKSSIIATRKLIAGETVGYGAAWRCPKDTIIGVIAIGYGDGYPRHAQNGTPVLVNGRRVPLVGRVSMDMITVDLGCDAQDKVGDEAILWGQGLAVEEIAEYATTIPYELLCNITRRVHIEVQ
jgi:alanine racemase